MKIDHFHAIYELDGEEHEMEGGWSGEVKRLTAKDKGSWMHNLCVAWGMPEEGKVKKLWLAG
jgi:hypothetical protein